MCTALAFKTENRYFGRNLDMDVSYGEEICVIPRNYAFKFKNAPPLSEHYAMIGMATIIDGVPLFYDATNEHGLSAAGLNFPKNAVYYPLSNKRENIAPFELIPRILGSCKNATEAKALLQNLNLADIPFSEEVPLTPLHWLFSDGEEHLIAEPTDTGLKIIESPVGVLTNNPPYEYQLFNLNNYRNLRVDNGENLFSEKLDLEEYCQGLGALGLPGDVSSQSRFVRAAFNLLNSVCDKDELSSVSQFFHVLSSVEMIKGCCSLQNGRYDATVYSSCVNADEGKYYYATYLNRRIRCVDMRKTDLNGSKMSRFPLILREQIVCDN